MILILSGIIALGGCGEKDEEVLGEPEYADSITETAITSLSDGDYDKHLSVFTERK